MALAAEKSEREKADRARETDARLWLNAHEIASGLRRPPTTIYDALADLSNHSKRVGRERRYAWDVAFQLADRYAVPFAELAEGVGAALEERARALGADREELWKLFTDTFRAWSDTGSAVPDWGVSTLPKGGRAPTEPMFARALAASRAGKTPRVLSRISGDPDVLLAQRKREETPPIATKLAAAFSEPIETRKAQRTAFRARGSRS
jgi:hypothetical protein